MKDYTTEYPEVYQQWVEAGGIRNNFAKHLLGLGVLTPTAEDMLLLINENLASASQLHHAGRNFPFRR